MSGSLCCPRFYQVVYLENVFGRLNTYKNVQANVCTHTACDEYGTVEFSAVMLSEVNISIYSLNLDLVLDTRSSAVENKLYIKLKPKQFHTQRYHPNHP